MSHKAITRWQCRMSKFRLDHYSCSQLGNKEKQKYMWGEDKKKKKREKNEMEQTDLWTKFVKDFVLRSACQKTEKKRKIKEKREKKKERERPPAWAHLHTLPLCSDVVPSTYPSTDLCRHEGKHFHNSRVSFHVEHGISRSVLIFLQTWAMNSAIPFL